MPSRRPLALLAALLAAALAAPGAAAPAVPPLPGDDPAATGRWDAPVAWPTQAIHAALLPTGKVLAFGSNAGATLWDPATGTFTPVPIPGAEDMVCSGMAMLADGRVLVTGGHASAGAELWNGHPVTWLFDPFALTWTRGDDLNAGRYYPTAITLGDGRVLASNGNDEHGGDPYATEVWDGASWQRLPGMPPRMEFYPRMHVLPNGTVVSAGQDPNAMLLDPATGQWTVGPRSEAGRRWGGASVLLPGLDKVLVFGGGNTGFSSEGHGGVPLLRDPADLIAANHFEAVTDGPEPGTTSAEILDVSGGAPAYRTVGAMTYPRRDHAGVLLADGDVLALGGSVGYEPVPGWGDYAFHPELFDVATERWSLVAPAHRTRGYHSTGLLLPDGRVWFGGGDFELARDGSLPLTSSGEVYSPPYLFRGPRPSIVSAPSAAAYGERLSIRKAGPKVTGAALVRLSATTHSLNTDQRWVGLPVEESGDLLHVVAPAGGNAAPPGYYLLFLLSDRGVPSVASVVRLG
ncbi:MAG TPA: galactose oxidase-like domain-containing protein [Frankiaceae bacterium]|jgi:hypothetical protein|nr:galactose oxidase-like domain-containing protein [Frankiaceae bacterium]